VGSDGPQESCVGWGFIGADGRCHGNQFWDAFWTFAYVRVSEFRRIEYFFADVNTSVWTLSKTLAVGPTLFFLPISALLLLLMLGLRKLTVPFRSLDWLALLHSGPIFVVVVSHHGIM